MKRLNDNGYDIIVISNQGGVSKKYFSKVALDTITRNMLKELDADGVKIRKVYYCIHQDSDNCDCRKPKTGMFRQAEDELKIKRQGAYFIGDGKTDVDAGKSAGLKTVLVLSGKTTAEDIKDWELKPDHTFNDLPEAVEFIMREEKE